jgi:phosphonate transport system substrate-binding protein
MAPFKQYLEAAMAKRGVPIKLNMRIFSAYSEALDAVVQGETDIARLGPASYVTAKQRNPRLPILVVESHGGSHRFSGVIVVPKDSPIRTIADLRGKRFAFGEPLSTTGRYMPQAQLIAAGIHAPDLAEFDYLGRHDKVAFAVAAGSYDAGGTNESMLMKYGESKGLRMLASYQSPTHAWVTRVGFDPKLTNVLREVLLEMKGVNLQYIGRDGFLPGSDANYDELREAMRRARDFGG